MTRLIARRRAIAWADGSNPIIVRDICRLRPRVDGVGDTVTVRSLTGRFLEHSQVFYFLAGGAERFYLGSADWMTRNLDNRVEAVTPVEDPDLQARLRAVLRLNLQDTRRACELAADGTYTRCRPGEDPVVDTHARLMTDAATAGARPQRRRRRAGSGGPAAPDKFDGPP